MPEVKQDAAGAVPATEIPGAVAVPGNVVGSNAFANVLIRTGAGLLADADPTLATNSDQRVPTQKAVKAALASLGYADISGLDSSEAGALYLLALSALDAAARLNLLLALFEDGADDESEDAGNLRGRIAALTAQALGADGVTVVTDGALVSLPYATSSGVTNRSWGFDDSGNFWLPTYAETLTALASVAATVPVTGSGEKDVTVTAATTNIRIAPTGGNMTIDQVTGLYMGQAINVTLVQDSTDRTLALAGGSNAVLGHDDALDMPSGSGEVARGLLVGMDDGTGAIVPHFFAV